MTTTHVFIVDTNTFKYHLEYLFAGTGSKENFIDFNNCKDSNLNPKTEISLVEMIADSQRVRKGDFIVFYLQQNFNESVWEGKFFGIFKAKEDFSFLDNNDANKFLKQQLNKSLTFRTIIEPYEVYSKGVTEWEALDEIKNLSSPNQMLWSLIYRKLKGNRGNTMITIYESERLFKLLRDKNNHQILSENSFSFDLQKQEIIITESKHLYSGRKEVINIMPRLINKLLVRMAFEAHLQAYIVQNIGRGKNRSLDIALTDNIQIEWLGNEVSCGVGMQRIDVMLSLAKENSKVVVPIELKSVEAKPKVINQIQRYVDWLEQYYIPNRISDIQPVLISKKIENKTSENYKSIIQSFYQFNEKNKCCYPLKYIEFELIENSLNFQVVKY